MTSFAKHRRQPAGKSLVRLKLKVTSLLTRVWADLLQNILVYFWSLNITLFWKPKLNEGEAENSFFTSSKLNPVLTGSRVHVSFYCLKSSHLSHFSCAVKMWVCQLAEKQLAAPVSTQSLFWNMAFFSVYWFLSWPNLKWGGEGLANHSSRLPTVLNPPGIDLENACVEFYTGKSLTQKRLWKCLPKTNQITSQQPLSACLFWT